MSKLELTVRAKVVVSLGALLLLAIGTPAKAAAQSPNDWDPAIPRMYACYG